MYAVKFESDFGFIKPWSAVRDSKTKSNHFLTPSILKGMERKLFPETSVNDNGRLNKIVRHRLSFSNIYYQQEQTESINYLRAGKTKKNHYFKKNGSIVTRGVLINPVLYLIFNNKNDAQEAMSQHICLCRNEDVMFPTDIRCIDDNELNESELFYGYESVESNDDGIYCGYNKYTNEKQYININVIGTPLNMKIEDDEV